MVAPLFFPHSGELGRHWATILYSFEASFAGAGFLDYLDNGPLLVLTLVPSWSVGFLMLLGVNIVISPLVRGAFSYSIF